MSNTFQNSDESHTLMELRCSNCDHQIDVDAIDMNTMTTTCPKCGTPLDFSDVVLNYEMPEPEPVDLPTLFNVRSLDSGEEISYRWFSWRAPVYLVVGLLLVGTPIMLFNAIGGEGYSIQGLLRVALLLIAVFGLVVLYFGLANFLNTTHITMNRRVVRVRHRPFPMRGNVTLNRADVNSVLTKRVAHANRYGDSYTYEVHIQMKDGSHRVVVRGLHQSNQADYIKQQILRLAPLKEMSMKS